MNQSLEDFIKNKNNVLAVINEINSSFPSIMETYIPTSPHRDPIQYFLTQSCPTYATLLHEIFKGYAQYYDSDIDGHVVVRIGDEFYDVNGINNNPKIEEFSYRLCKDNEYGFVLMKFGRNDGIDEIIYPKLLEVGQKALQEELQKSKEKTR